LPPTSLLLFCSSFVVVVAAAAVVVVVVVVVFCDLSDTKYYQCKTLLLYRHFIVDQFTLKVTFHFEIVINDVIKC
jgi:hypothetical protein